MGPQQCGTISPCEARGPELVSYQIVHARAYFSSVPDERDAQRRANEFPVVVVRFSAEFRVKNYDRFVIALLQVATHRLGRQFLRIENVPKELRIGVNWRVTKGYFSLRSRGVRGSSGRSVAHCGPICAKLLR